ncbi:helix-turn-helix domain-containing protein [Fibrella forsythiae]|uniref:Helix-turn-helix transcriptional regulator n=1 Tax=Fibrella forsythiae TaxID=2817061 RepID=A0ABS3JS86_9BACT|nr:helix-turn-helix transcriptional regulator [Fibrella forsythiae]MBO0952838.1 helix-turn-helix transcriptional regulator [Fibrella forsythiae]
MTERAAQTIKQQVGGLIREARKAKGLTLKELGDKVGLLEPTLSKYETGKINPSLDMLERIAQELGFKLEIKLK